MNQKKRYGLLIVVCLMPSLCHAYDICFPIDLIVKTSFLVTIGGCVSLMHNILTISRDKWQSGKPYLTVPRYYQAAKKDEELGIASEEIDKVMQDHFNERDNTHFKKMIVAFSVMTCGVVSTVGSTGIGIFLGCAPVNVNS